MRRFFLIVLLILFLLPTTVGGNDFSVFKDREHFLNTVRQAHDLKVWEMEGRIVWLKGERFRILQVNPVLEIAVDGSKQPIIIGEFFDNHIGYKSKR